METRPWHRHYDYNVPTTIRYPRIAAQAIFQLAAGTFPDRPATNFYGTELTFWQLRDQMLRMANALGTLGVKKGDRVGIHLPTCPQFVIAYLATLSLGAVVVNLNPLASASELKFIIQTTGLETLFTFDMMLANVRGAVAGHGGQAGDRDQGDRLHHGVRREHRQGPGARGGMAPLLRADRGEHRDAPPPRPLRSRRSRPDPVHRRHDGHPQGRGPDPRQRRGRDTPGLALGGPDDRAHPAGKAERPERPPLLPRLRQHRLHELGLLQLRDPDPGPALRDRRAPGDHRRASRRSSSSPPSPR